MRITGDAVLNAPVQRVWDALLDPEVLVRTIPGCERLETTGENTYAMTVNAGVAAVRGTYAGSCALQDLHPHESLVLRVQGAGAPGTIGADVGVTFHDNEDHTTRVDYDADAVVGGMVGGVGQRMLTSAARRTAGDFFANVDRVLTGAEEPAAPEGASAEAASEIASADGTRAAAPTTFTAPARASRGGSEDLVKGMLLGAGLVLAGVAAGALGRRRG